MTMSLWTTPDRSRYFLIADDRLPPPGSLAIRRLVGDIVLAEPGWLAPFAITEEQARRIAKDQLSQTLEELNIGINDELTGLREQLTRRENTPVTPQTTLTPNAAPALLDLLKQLPRVIAYSLAHDAQRVEAAKSTMADLQRRLQEAGIDLDQRFTSFPERLAELRADVREPKP